MPTEQDLKGFKRRQGSVSADDSQKLVQNLPPFPQDVKDRFPSMAKLEQDQKDWTQKLIISIRGGAA